MVELCKPSTRAEWALIEICWERSVSNENTRIIYVKTSHRGAISQQVVNVSNWRNAYSSQVQNVQKIQVKTLVNKKQTAKHLNPQPPGTTDSRGVVE